MAFLFTVTNGIAHPNVETLLIEPFKTIWERDTSEDKSVAIKEFTYIELMSSKKKSNPYAGYSDEDRHLKLVENIFHNEWTMDHTVELALAKIVEFQEEASPTYSYYISALEAMNKMKQFFRDFDLNARNPKGFLLYKPKDITSAIADTDKVLHNLNTLKEKVEQEIFEMTKTKGGKDINHFER